MRFIILINLLIALAISQEQYSWMDYSLVEPTEDNNTLESRVTQNIFHHEDHQQCNVYQGKDLTLVKCKDAYEMYQTSQLATQTNTLVNYGREERIYGVR
jgi:6-phosphogluconolactonase/glucosamine-6-phosphate isomerase/deaminase